MTWKSEVSTLHSVDHRTPGSQPVLSGQRRGCYSITPEDLRVARDSRALESGRGDELPRELVIVHVEGGAHHTMAVGGHSVAPRVRDLGNQPVAAELDDEP